MYKPFTLLSVLFLNPPWPKKNIHIFKSVNIKNNGFTLSVLPVTSSIKLKSDPVHCFVYAPIFPPQSSIRDVGSC